MLQHTTLHLVASCGGTGGMVTHKVGEGRRAASLAAGTLEHTPYMIWLVNNKTTWTDINNSLYGDESGDFYHKDIVQING